MTLPRRHIVHLSSVHAPGDPRIYHKECQSLASAGFQVGYVAPGAIGNDGDAVRLVAVPVERTRLRRMILSPARIFVSALKEGADAYHFHDPELIPVGIALKIRRKLVVYDVHETVPKQILSKGWIPKVLRPKVAAAVGGLERVGSSVFDGVVAATPGIAEYFPDKKTIVVRNFARITEFEQRPNMPYSERPRTVAYVGNITQQRGIVEMVAAMSHVDNARFALGGTFQTDALANEVRSMAGWSKVDELGWLDRPSVYDTLGRSRVGLLLLHPEANYLDAYPVKLFEYMLAGIPVVASNFPFWNQFVSDIGSGLMVDPLDPLAIAHAITWLLDHPEEAEEMGKRGREAVLRQFTWEHEAERLVNFYRDQVFA